MRQIDGIIPAYAGNTDVCGRGPETMAGSSPHTRGTRRSPSSGPCAAGDHPRIRGEHHQVASAHGTRVGSSPHTRGTPVLICRLSSKSKDHPRIRGEHPVMSSIAIFTSGIIPAYAGNTISVDTEADEVTGSSPHTRGTLGMLGTCGVLPRDHPRIRGEHGRRPARRRHQEGIIPAYAGNTLASAISVAIQVGSSPHTRGTRR